eukprot:SAG11_NODE_300_length_11057_cov_5.223469_10_plen_115_part_00
MGEDREQHDRGARAGGGTRGRVVGGWADNGTSQPARTTAQAANECATRERETSIRKPARTKAQAADECATAECCRALLCGANFAQWMRWVWRGAGRKLRAHLRADGTRSAALLR